MKFLKAFRSEVVVVIAAMLFVLSFIPGVVSAQTKPLQVGGLPVT